MPLSKVAGATLLVYATWAGCMVLLVVCDLAAAGFGGAWIAAPLAQAQNQASQLRGELGRTPHILTVELWDTFHYDIEHHKRTRDAQIVLELDAAWTADDCKVFSAGQWVKDSTHRAFTQYGVNGDPLVFRTSDDQLVAKADGRLVDDASAVSESWIVDFYRSESKRARKMAQSEPHGASDVLLALYLGGGAHVDGDTKRLVAGHLGSHYELGSPATLTK